MIYEIKRSQIRFVFILEVKENESSRKKYGVRYHEIDIKDKDFVKNIINFLLIFII